MKCQIFGSILIILLFLSCKPEKYILPEGIYSNGIFVVNEGIYGQSSGTITFYQPDSQAVYDKIFRNANGRDLGNVVQSLYFNDDNAFIVVNNSNKIEVVNSNDFTELAQINNLEQPRYFLNISDNRAIVSQWGLNLLEGSLALIDLENYTVIKKISQGIGKGPEKMLKLDNRVFITNVGGLEYDNFISVLDLQSHEIVDSIFTDDAPNSIQQASNGKIWVACKGKTVFSAYPQIDTIASTSGTLLELDPVTLEITHRIVFNKGEGVSNLVKSGNSNMMYFLRNGNVCKLNPITKEWEEIILGNYYGLGAYNNKLYISENSGIQAASVFIFNEQNLVRIDSFRAGVFANSMLFR